MRTTRIVVGSLIALVALVASCSEDIGPNTPMPSSAFPPTGATGAPTSPATGPATGPTGGIPTSTGSLSAGEVSFQLSGDIEVETTIANLISGVFAPAPGGMAVVWTAGGTDATTVGIGGTSFVGSRPTAPSLSLTIAAQTPDGIVSFLSIDGECSVTIDVADEGELAGSFVCDGLADPTGVIVDVSGSFRATG